MRIRILYNKNLLTLAKITHEYLVIRQ